MRSPLFPALPVLLLGATAFASSNFPPAVRTSLGLSYEPECSLCHFNGVTGVGTVTTLFGKSMRARGLTASSASSLSNALARMATDKVDSDHDGVTDLDELKAGTDPNVARTGTPDAGSGPPGLPPPSYGCSAVPAGEALLLTWGVALLAAGLARRRAPGAAAARRS